LRTIFQRDIEDHNLQPSGGALGPYHRASQQVRARLLTVLIG
jgi:hypothetical protein